MALAKYARTCGKNIPGNKRSIYLAPIGNITSVTETSNEISAVTMEGVTKFLEVQGEIDSVQYTSEGTFSTSGAETQNLIVGLGLNSTELELLKTELVSAIACGLAAIWVDGNGKAWLAGVSVTTKEGLDRPFNTLTTNFDSGLLPTDTDAAKYTITLTRLSGYGPVEFDGTLTTAIVGGSAAFIDYN